MYAPEQYVEAPPTVETLRFSVQQLLRMRGSSRSDNYPVAHPQPQQANQQPNQSPAAHPPAQNIQQQPPQQPAAYQQPAQQPAAYRQQPQRACFNCGDPSHFVVDCPLKDHSLKRVQQQVNSCHTNPSGGWTCPSQPHGMNCEVFPASLPTQGTFAFCINCGRTGHSASECMAPEHMKQEEQVRAAWYASPPNQLDSVEQDDQVRVISVAEAGGPSRPIVVTCGEKQVLTTLEAAAPNCTESLISIHLLLSAEQKLRPALTLAAQLKEELCRNTKYTIAARPLPHFDREDETKLAPIQKVETISPVPVAINVDGVDMKFDAIIVLGGHFPQGLYLGRQELPCYNIRVQDVQGEARMDERCSLVVAFGNTLQEPIPLYGMIDTGSGVSILSLNAYQKIASAHVLSLLPYDIQLYAASGKTINTIGIADNVNFHLSGHTLKTNFVVIADYLAADDFLLSRKFLRTYNVLVDLTAMRVPIRDPKSPRHFKPVHEVSDH